MPFDMQYRLSETSKRGAALYLLIRAESRSFLRGDLGAYCIYAASTWRIGTAATALYRLDGAAEPALRIPGDLIGTGPGPATGRIGEASALRRSVLDTQSQREAGWDFRPRHRWAAIIAALAPDRTVGVCWCTID
jgi:hypothetical protein